MRKLREMLRLHFEVGLSNREISRSLAVSHSTVNDLLGRFQVAGLAWLLPEDVDEALEAALYTGNTGKSRRRPEPDWNRIHHELSRKGVTLQLLWFEYKDQHPDGYQYSQFCERYRLFSDKLDVVMRQDHRAGEKVFVDYAGLRMPITDPRTGQVSEVPIFVATLGASSYTYVEATAAEDLRSFIGAHCRAFEFFGGVSEVIVPDNAKTGVTRPEYYEPDLNPTYLDMASFYGAAVIPTRSARPRDKGKVERLVRRSSSELLPKQVRGLHRPQPAGPPEGMASARTLWTVGDPSLGTRRLLKDCLVNWNSCRHPAPGRSPAVMPHWWLPSGLPSRDEP